MPAALIILGILALFFFAGQSTASGGGSERLPPGANPPPPPAPPSTGSGLPLPGPHNEWDNQIAYACGTVGLTDPRVWVRLKAMVMRESGFDPGALGDPNASAVYISASAGVISGYCSFGLGQVNNCAHPELGAAYDLLDGNQNLLAAAQVFAGCLQANGGDLDAATRCYNGSGAGTYVYLAAVRANEISWGVV